MKERPIIFNAPMVRAILEGRKTQTRRVVKHVETNEPVTSDPRPYGKPCPYGKPGDRLWVRENGWERPDRTKQIREGADTWAPYYYDADGICVEDIDGFGFKRRPSIFMPRWAFRLTLEITAVRVERLQDISEEDAMKEGVVPFAASRHTPANFRDGFTVLWQSIHGPGSWDANPWVWVLEFKRVEVVK